MESNESAGLVLTEDVGNIAFNQAEFTYPTRFNIIRREATTSQILLSVRPSVIAFHFLALILEKCPKDAEADCKEGEDS